MKREIKNKAASVRAKLMNIARAEKRKELLEKIKRIESHIISLNEQKKKLVCEMDSLPGESPFKFFNHFAKIC